MAAWENDPIVQSTPQWASDPVVEQEAPTAAPAAVEPTRVGDTSVLQQIVDTLLKRTQETANLGAGAIRGAGSI